MVFERFALGRGVVSRSDGAPMNRTAVMTVCTISTRVLLGCWFVYSGGRKVFVSGLDRFTQDVANYRIVPAPLDAIAAYSVPWFEIAAGMCLMLGILRKGAVLTLGVLVCVFAICIGWAWSHQLDISCGCHGGDARIHYWGKTAELVGYFIVLGWLWCREDPASIAKQKACGDVCEEN
jgi:uncharacterized membrane protein YphA (DoxX/SURF4 family)